MGTEATGQTTTTTKKEITMAEKLKPCPFCGGEAEFERTGTRRQSAIVACTNCGCRLESSDEDERSHVSWNRRPTEKALFAACECEEALQMMNGNIYPYDEMTAILKRHGWDGEEIMAFFVKRIRREAIAKARGTTEQLNR